MKQGLFLLLIGLIIIACGNDNETQISSVNPVSSGDELLADNDVGDMASFPDIAEKEAEAIQRSFENAPPLIPHAVQDYIITRTDNECLLCHLPEKAKDKRVKSMPATHFTDYRPEIKETDKGFFVDAEENEVVANETGGELNQAMYYCNLCHVPQADIDPMVQNNFEAVYRDMSSKKTSNLNETISEGVK